MKLHEPFSLFSCKCVILVLQGLIGYASFKDKWATNHGYWIGLNDITSEGHFKWLDDIEEANYTSWNPSDPNNYGNQDCACVLYKNENRKWFDKDCYDKKNFLCEKCPVTYAQMYGVKCLERCSESCGGLEKACHRVNGSCISGCDAGYQGPTCDTECDEHMYGRNCSERCSIHCGGLEKACHNVDGSCISGCDAGYQGPKCDTACSKQTFGPGCLENCSGGCGGRDKACHNVHGVCLDGCVPGYQGEMCDTCDERTFGPDCGENCSSNCAGLLHECHNVNGTCTLGCVEGYQGDKCDTIIGVDNRKRRDKDDKTDEDLASDPWITIAAIAVLVIITCLAIAFLTFARPDYEGNLPGRKSSADGEEDMVYPERRSADREMDMAYPEKGLADNEEDMKYPERRSADSEENMTYSEKRSADSEEDNTYPGNESSI